MNTDLTGRVALITGASQGIGEAIARALHREGAKVALVARTQAKLDAIARDLGDRAFAVAADVLDAASLSTAIAAAERRLGPIDIAVNNAGGIVTSDGALFRPFEAVSDADWLGTFELNVMSAVRVSRALAPKMAERGWGRIIPNIVLGRAGSSEEVAAAVVFLASDAASFITGANLRVDGGSVATA